jgi:hypothetical protein
MAFLTIRQMLEITDDQLKQILSLKAMEGHLEIVKDSEPEMTESEQIKQAAVIAEAAAPDFFDDVMPDYESCIRAAQRLKFITK